MSKKIVLKKATRVEGNANIQIEIDNGHVKNARFMVQDFRGFEKFLQQRRVEFVPHLVSRICGLCSVSHQVASLRAIEDGIGVVSTTSTQSLRKIIALGEQIGSHAFSYFFLTMPDYVGAHGGVFDLLKSHPDLMKDAFMLRNAGQKIVEILGKRAVHPVSMGVGRFLVEPTADDLKKVKELAAQIKTSVGNLIIKAGSLASQNNKIQLPTNQQINFVSYDDHPQAGQFHVYDEKGQCTDSFKHDNLEDNVSEMLAEWSLAKFPYLKRHGFPEGIMLVGPLSRSFQKNSFLNDSEISDFDLSSRVDCTNPSLESYDTCRLLEIFWSAKQILQLLEEINLEDLKTKVDFKVSGKGIGIIEAPRGILVHSYLINQGCIERVKLLVATQFNNPFINLLIRDLAEKHAEKDGLNKEGDHLIGRCIRIFDPCLSCATH